MRMVGMTRAGIVQLLLTQTLVFSVPAWALGLVAANFLAALILQKVGEITSTEIEAWLVRDSVAWATVMGLLVPCCAALLPIRMALTSTLHDALDINRPKVFRAHHMQNSPPLLCLLRSFLMFAAQFLHQDHDWFSARM